MKNILLSPILYAVIGVIINTIIIYSRDYKKAKALQGTGKIEYNFNFFSTNIKIPPTLQNIVNLILVIATIITFAMSESKKNDAIAVILIYVIVNILRPIIGSKIFSKIAAKN